MPPSKQCYCINLLYSIFLLDVTLYFKNSLCSLKSQFRLCKVTRLSCRWRSACLNCSYLDLDYSLCTLRMWDGFFVLHTYFSCLFPDALPSTTVYFWSSFQDNVALVVKKDDLYQLTNVEKPPQSFFDSSLVRIWVIQQNHVGCV